jgi:hypothetical protein
MGKIGCQSPCKGSLTRVFRSLLSLVLRILRNAAAGLL